MRSSSSIWFRVGRLRPRLKAHTSIHRHRYRGHVSHVVQSGFGKDVVRLSKAGYLAVGLMDGCRTMDEIWQCMCGAKDGQDVRQDDLVNLLAQLHASDMLDADLPPDLASIQSRFEKKRRRERISRFANPLAMRVSLLDPDDFLSSSAAVGRFLFSHWGLLVWAALISSAVAVVALHWPVLTGGLADRILAPGNLLLMLVLFPVVKSLHELGHGYAVKRWGGEVHDMGVMFLVFLPVPYVDASAANAFPDKWRRFAVGGAGMYVETGIAALALLAWAALEPGLLRAALFNVALLAGVSTVIFNANPLLKFDGYYMLADLVEIPNLGIRSTGFWGWIGQRFILADRRANQPDHLPSERRWLVAYAPLSYGYRLAVAFSIAAFVALSLPSVGLLLAVLTLVMAVGLPAYRVVRRILAGPEFAGRREIVVARAGVWLAVVVGIVALLPIPFAIRTEAILVVPDERHVRTAVDCELMRILRRSGEMVGAGEVIAECADPKLVSRGRVVEARVSELELIYRARRQENVSEALQVQAQLEAARRELEEVRQQLAYLQVRSAAAGRLMLPMEHRLEGMFLTRGSLLGYVLPERADRARAVIRQVDIDLIGDDLKRIEVRPVHQLGHVTEAHLLRVVPKASKELPSPALSRDAGGQIALDPTARRDDIAYESVFEIDLSLKDPIPGARFGSRLQLRLDLGWASISEQAYRLGGRELLRVLHGSDLG